LTLHNSDACRFLQVSKSLVEVLMRYFFFLLPIFLLNVYSWTIHATIIHVPGDSTTIQGGINGAVDGDTVMVATGTYYEHGIDFLGKGITVMGTDPEDSAVVAATVVDANSEGRGFIFRSGEDSTSVLSGLTVTGGYIRFAFGCGIYCDNASSPTITNNIITMNRALMNGGGIGCVNSSSPKIMNNIISNNRSGNDGGGFFITDDSSPEITNNIIIGNIAYEEGGGGIFCWDSSPVVSNNIIANNRSIAFGAGIDCDWYSSMTISNNIIVGNMTVEGEGGGIRCQGSSAEILNNLIVDNYAGHEGGGLSCQDTEATIVNNTITGNSADDGGGIYCRDNSTLVVTNTVLWGNEAVVGKEIYVGRGWDPSTVTISYSDVEGGQALVYVEDNCTLDWGEGMIDSDPFFISFSGFDYLLRRGSPCIDSGDPSLEDGINWPVWYQNASRSDMGAYGGPGNVGWLQ